MKLNRWNDSSLSEKLGMMGSKVSHTSVGYWRHGKTKPRKKFINLLSEIAGFPALLFFLDKIQVDNLELLKKKT